MELQVALKVVNILPYVNRAVQVIAMEHPSSSRRTLTFATRMFVVLLAHVSCDSY